MVKKCDCEHKYQDKKYGPGMRVMNPMTKTDGVRCTVCAREHLAGMSRLRRK